LMMAIIVGGLDSPILAMQPGPRSILFAVRRASWRLTAGAFPAPRLT
jgi:hypothetical protein